MNNLIQREPDPTWKPICEKCHDGDIEPDCEYYGEPNGCNSPIYGEHPKPVEPVSNVAAMREVVIMLANVILPQQAEYPAEYGGGKVPDKDGWLAWVRAMQIKARAVLDMQPRNCDVGTAEEQARRYLKFCVRQDCEKACPFRDCRNSYECAFSWAQMAYTKGECDL